uniref:Uncharacterized protein n=1 Tax=Nicotiana tabacum TaxID=4097 RepID=A0A1S4CKI5_TOBAC|nr:PREDICTED: uncharacterized protein LOC107820054 [Nicotiana tabacum]
MDAAQNPLCAQETLDLLNCTTEKPYDKEKCQRLLESLRQCVLNKPPRVKTQDSPPVLRQTSVDTAQKWERAFVKKQQKLAVYTFWQFDFFVLYIANFFSFMLSGKPITEPITIYNRLTDNQYLIGLVIGL